MCYRQALAGKIIHCECSMCKMMGCITIAIDVSGAHLGCDIHAARSGQLHPAGCIIAAQACGAGCGVQACQHKFDKPGMFSLITEFLISCVCFGSSNLTDILSLCD